MPSIRLSAVADAGKLLAHRRVIRTWHDIAVTRVVDKNIVMHPPVVLSSAIYVFHDCPAWRRLG